MTLQGDQVRRYSRHVLLPDVGGTGQARLLAAAVRVEVGRDRAAEEVAVIYLAAAGLGRVVLGGDVDAAVTAADVTSGLPFGVADVGRPRGAALAARARAINPDVVVATDTGAGAAAGAGDVLPCPVAILDLPAIPGAALADALVRGGAAAARLIHVVAAPASAAASPPGRTP